MSLATAAQAGLADGDKVTVATEQGSVTVPVEVVPMAGHVVWLPAAGLTPEPGPTTRTWRATRILAARGFGPDLPSAPSSVRGTAPWSR